MKIKSFEDLECWKEARALTRTIYTERTVDLQIQMEILSTKS